MIDPSERLMSRPLDWALTNPALRAAAAVLYLTDKEREELNAVAGTDLRLVHLANGVPIPDAVRTSVPREAEILFVGRLAAIKRPTVFASVAKEISAEFPKAKFTLIGPDEGELSSVREHLTDRVKWEGALPPDEIGGRLARARALVLPSLDDVYPMIVLEALAAAVPVIVTHGCGLADLVAEHRCGLVVPGRREDLADAMRVILTDDQFAAWSANNARSVAKAELSITSVVDELEDLYSSLIEAHRHAPA
jgi:glycosyltransferase involved in cell wall biosynthesis